MKTEKATKWLDLPHEFAHDKANVFGLKCRCGRYAGNQLHAEAAREIASTGTTMAREIGS